MALQFFYDFGKKESRLLLLDQTLLPHEEIWNEISSVEQMIRAIQLLQVRGAPLIGVAASLCLAQESLKNFDPFQLNDYSQQLRAARPTAVNLMNAIDEMVLALEQKSQSNFFDQAVMIFNRDVDLCENIALSGVHLFQDGDNILTHCNTGGLATAGIGTALGVLRKVFESGKKIHVYVDETRPLLQGGRLTTWELDKLKIPYTLIADNMAASLMRSRKIDKAIVGSDRIAANGDFANKIGTYSIASLCAFHKIPFYVAAPMTTVDSKCESGAQIEIEQRNLNEVRGYVTSKKNIIWAPTNSNVYNPSFDVTPAYLVSGWIMDKKAYVPNDVLNGCFRRGLK